MTRRPGTVAVLLSVLALLLAGCGGTDGNADARAASDQLAQARSTLDQASAVTIDLSTPRLPRGVQGVLRAKGTGTRTPPAFKGTISVIRSGLSVAVPVISVDGKVYVKFVGTWQTIDPTSVGAPDPANFFRTGGLDVLLSGYTDVEAGDDVRDGRDVYSTVTAKVPGADVAKIIPTADDSEDFAVKYTLGDDDTLVKAVVRGPFYPDAADVTYTVAFSDYGRSTSISAP